VSILPGQALPLAARDTRACSGAGGVVSAANSSGRPNRRRTVCRRRLAI